ncbi:hypothetical protein RUM43_009849 [Polyplax serrata]|uniref:Midasin n=1 Tax=Polyplax serrata TaxID=468196 RepID=A0AAN8S6X5_POLSC
MEQPSGLTIADIFFPCSINTRKKNATQKDSDFVYKKGSSPYSNLQQLVLAAACRRPVLLKGPVGSGKTSTVEYFARATGHKSPNSNDDLRNTSLFIKVQLGEQTDSRMLLGGYQCTEIPGQFIWKPGVLTQAVMKGYWLLLEDIDCSSSDVITIIENLIKTQTLFIPGYGESIILHPQFQLFATQRTLGHESTSCMRSNVLKQWITIYLSPLSNSEIVDIVTEKYPRLKTVAEKMVSVLDVDFTSYSMSNRLPSVRDILKWCNRSQSYFETGSPESALKIFQDAVDIFCGFMEKGLQFTVATQIGLKLGIVQNKANFISSTYKPNIVVSNKDLLAGRASLQRQKDSVTLINRAKNYVFSLTKQSCCLIEKISCCLQNNESVLLVGETGCGKTTVLQYIADVLGRTLVVINMNQQSDAADLLGGYKPVTFKWVMKPFCEKFEILFRDLFNPKKNADCLNKFSKLLKKENWDVLLGFIAHVQKRALTQITTKLDGFKAGGKTGRDKEEVTKWKNRLTEWTDLSRGIEKYSKQREAAQKSLVFSYVEGSLVTAMRKGHWVLLDEINLATSETLDCLSGLLENSRESITLLEKGDNCPIYRDSGFRLFAAMNPATDVGKKQLPIGLRNRFTELFIDELDDVNDLRPLIETYLCELNQSPTRLKKIANFYLKVKKRLKNQILDGCGRKPHFSLRNLCRALQITAKNPCGTFARSLYESLSVSFLTQLDSKSYKMVLDLITETVTESDIKSVLNQPIPKPEVGEHVNLEGFWLPVGSLEPSVPDNYILTPTVRRHLRDLIKIVSLATGVPVLLEGDTSVGKTSLINYLAKCTGNVCSRVNNHEHTDIQEYIGTYVADCNGKLVFKEGILCECMRKGHWLILDELNLAPTEVLEALNRVLDDNRELFIPETQTTIRAHDRFLLFATQNPPGLYGGRKELSRAFRNRFVELQFNQIPPAELVTILEKRCQLPLNYCKKMVGVMTDLQLMRRGSDIFVGKAGFITLRDLFRWGERYHKARVEAKFHDWEQHLGDEGYILLAGRVRLLEESKVIEEVIAKHFKRRPDPNNLFCLHENTSAVSRNILESLINQSRCEKEFSHIVWTYSMRRLAVLVCKALDFSEPVLIVGETGCGKTSVVQMLAKMKNRDLYSVNCHMHSESTDFLGGLRPVRDESRTTGKLFEWCDGPLVKAMTSGSFFLADEISLADDSVLERLNSLLEPERTILLAEKGGGLIEDENEEYTTVAQENFQFIGTMNPGGDYGKKELSPALRNRFTEIWADSTFNKYESYCEIIRHNLILSSKLCSSLPEIMTGFLRWFQSTEIGKRVTLSTRDILTWVTFMNLSDLPWHESCIHGVCLTFLDGLGSGSRMVVSQNEIKNFKEECLEYLVKQINLQIPEKAGELSGMTGGGGEFLVEKTRVGIHPFYIRRGENATSESSYVFNAPTTLSNAKRILRSLKMNKAILLEGSPGVGKTSLITSLAKICGYKVTRINLSDQTDISDLLGADLPEEGGSAGHFVWRDGPFMTALKEGQWILLDELNLASQSVLEGLNAILDHRGSVYIPELNKVFHVSTKTRIFGCQNPLKEGGNRRGLPSSFLNRFTQVYLDSLTQSDYGVILKETFPALSTLRLNGEPITWLMIKFTSEMCQGVLDGRLTGPGGPWEFNLRDITRWAEGIMKDLNLGDADSLKSVQSIEGGKLLLRVAFKHMNLLYLNRFRSKTDRNMVYDIFTTFFGENDFGEEKPQIYITEDILVIGENVSNVNKSFFYGDLNEFEIFTIEKKPRGSKVKNNLKNEIRKTCAEYYGKRKLNDLRLLEQQYPILSSLCHCVNMNWLAILVPPRFELGSLDSKSRVLTITPWNRFVWFPNEKRQSFNT